MAKSEISVDECLSAVKNTGALEKPCLGQPFQLGMLYDCRSDRLIPGVTLWGSEALGKAVTQKPSETSDFEVIAEDSLKEKTSHLDVDAGLKLSILGGLVNVEGAAKFLNDRKSLKNQARVSLKYKSTTIFEQLTMDQLGNFEYKDVFDKDIATHVVTAMVYGVDAFFVFDREVSEEEDIKKIHGNLKVKIGGLPGLKNLAIEGKGTLDYENTEKDKEERLQCKFYGDLILPKHPTTFQEAAEIYHDLPNLLKGKSVPKKVWLYPLGKLDSRAQRMVREITSRLVDELHILMESLHDMAVRSNGLIRSEVSSYFLGLREGLETIKSLIEGYRSDLQKSLAMLLPKVRGGGTDEAMLAEILKENSLSPFSRQNLNSWISGKEKEVKVLASYLKSLRQLKNLHMGFECGEVDGMINDVDVEAVLCFDFNITWGEDSQLARMQTYLQTKTVSQTSSSVQPWYKSQSSMGKLRQQFHCFKNFVLANCEKQSVKFIVTNHDSELALDGEEVAVISLYESGIPAQFDPPDKPGKPEASDVTHESVQLTWAKPKHGAESIQSYTISYQVVKDSPHDDWQSIQCSATVESTQISLAPCTTYVFKVSANTNAGSSPESDISACVTTKVKIDRPGKPQISEVTHSSAQLKWDKPKIGADNIQSYTIFFHSVSDPPNQWCARKYSGIVPSFNCALDPSTIYVFKVRAETADEASPDSELSEPIETLSMPLSATILPACTLIKKGSQTNPPIYLLPTYDVLRNENIAKVMVGEEAMHIGKVALNKVLMVVGATGAGKSTLINGIANYVMGVSWGDDFRFKLINEPNSDDQSKSQTSTITAYTFPKRSGSRLPYSLTVIDTPGFGDTGGLKRDERITNLIKEFFRNEEEGIDQLHAIGFVTQAALARLTPTQRYIFDAILSVFGKDVGSNIHLMTTFADGKVPPVINAVRVADVPFKDHFKFNNSAIFSSKLSGGKFDELFWDMGIGSFKAFFDQFALMEPRSLHLTKEVLKEREHLEVSIQGLQPQICAGLAERDRLLKTERALKQHEAEIRDNKDFKITVTVSKMRTEPLPHGELITTCLACHFTCHKNCGIADDDRKHGCAAMTSGPIDSIVCTVCPNKCSWRMHKNTPYEYKLYQEEETQTLAEIKSRHESAVSGKLEVEGLINKIKEKMVEIDGEVDAMITQARWSLERLQEIALKPNPLSQVEYIDLLIESEKQQAQPGWQGRVIGLQNAREKAEMVVKIAKKEVGGFYASNQPPQSSANMKVATKTASKDWMPKSVRQFATWLTGSSAPPSHP